jgi:hypothetical protein
MRIGRIASWVLALGLAGAFVFMVGLPKFIGPSPNPIFALIAGRSGIDLFEPLVRYATGAAELIAAALLVWPATRRFGAMLAGAVTLGAIGFHLSPWLGVQLPNMEALTRHLQEGKSVAEIDAMNLPSDGGALFVTALVFLAIAAAMLWLERDALRKPA